MGTRGRVLCYKLVCHDIMISVYYVICSMMCIFTAGYNSGSGDYELSMGTTVGVDRQLVRGMVGGAG